MLGDVLDTEQILARWRLLGQLLGEMLLITGRPSHARGIGAGEAQLVYLVPLVAVIVLNRGLAVGGLGEVCLRRTGVDDGYVSIETDRIAGLDLVGQSLIAG